MLKPVAIAVAAAFTISALAQDKPAAPSWQQGKPPALQESTLHPFAPHMTGRPAKELPVDKLKVPAGFQIEVWGEGVPEARPLAVGDQGTLFVSHRLSEDGYAVVDRRGQREAEA